MRKQNIRQSFNIKRLKHGAFSTLFIFLFLAFLVVVNIAVSKLNIKKDLTQDKLYSISDQSIKILKDLKNETKLYVFYETGKEDSNIKNVLDKYKSASDKITVTYYDPSRQPQLVQKYSKPDKNVGVGSIVVESSNKFKTLSYDDFFNYSYEEDGSENLDSFAAEQQLTNAIVFVNSDKEQVIYNLSGHQEKYLPGDLIKQLEAENFTVKDINLLQGSVELNNDSILLVQSPKRDISKEEEAKIKDFLSKGGRAAFFMDITKEILPNFQELLSNYGIKLENALVIEGQAENIAKSPAELLPIINSHEIVDALKANKFPIFMPVSQGIEELKDKKGTLKIEPLLSTSKNSWGKVNLNATTMVKQQGDLQGPFNIAVAITNDDMTLGKNTKLVVVGGSSILNSDIAAATSGANIDFAMNSFNWLQDKKNSVSIRPKDITAPNLMINELQRLMLSGVVVILIPGIIIIAGIAVWVRRRHR